MKILLLQLDGKLPNIALMRIAAHYRGQAAHERAANGTLYRFPSAEAARAAGFYPEVRK